jgi:hypothetical protein
MQTLNPQAARNRAGGDLSDIEVWRAACIEQNSNPFAVKRHQLTGRHDRNST